MKHQRQRLKQALDNLRHALEETESVLLESDGTFFEEEEKQQVRQTQERRGEDLFSVMESVRSLGWARVGSTSVYRAERYPPSSLATTSKSSVKTYTNT
jgi:hypothetical protein